MKAPEKLYVDARDNLAGSCLWGFTEKGRDEDIEYVRKDAFIEKACEWLKDCLDNGMWIANDVGMKEKEAIIEDFRTFMKEK